MSQRIVLVDDHQMFREGLKSILEKEPDFEVAGEADNGLQGVKLSRKLIPTVVVMDISMPEMSGIEATRRIHAELPEVNVIILSMHTEKQYILGALKAGAVGVVVKSSATDELIAAINSVTQGQTYLSPSISSVVIQNLIDSDSRQEKKLLSSREEEILKFIALGMSAKEIAYQLRISNKTVEAHRTNLMKKLKIKNVPNLVKYAIREGIIDL